jgi:hypothetical protein
LIPPLLGRRYAVSWPCAAVLGTVDSLFSSTLFWIVIAIAFIAAELGITLMLVGLSVRPMRSRH